jgi:hypothetical protein
LSIPPDHLEIECRNIRIMASPIGLEKHFLRPNNTGRSDGIPKKKKGYCLFPKHLSSTIPYSKHYLSIGIDQSGEDVTSCSPGSLALPQQVGWGTVSNTCICGPDLLKRKTYMSIHWSSYNLINISK